MNKVTKSFSKMFPIMIETEFENLTLSIHWPKRTPGTRTGRTCYPS